MATARGFRSFTSPSGLREYVEGECWETVGAWQLAVMTP
jgi:hypothetical protein